MILKSLQTFAYFCFLHLVISGFAFAQTKGDLLPIQEKGLWGFVDSTGKRIIEPTFIYVDEFSEGLAIVQLEIGRVGDLANGKKLYEPSRFGYIDMSGNVVLKVPYDNVGEFVGGLAPVRVGDRNDGRYYTPGNYGFIDKTGTLVIEPQFEHVTSLFSDGLALMKRVGKWGFFDKDRKTVINARFSDAENFSEGLAAVKMGGKWGYIDTKGDMVIKPQFFRARDFSNGLASISKKQYGNWGYIDRTGKIVIEIKYNEGGPFRNGMALVREFTNNSFRSYCINKANENLPIEACDQGIKAFPMSKIVAGKKVFVDESGKILFEDKWDYHKGFKNGVALVFNSAKGKYWCGLHVPGWVSITDACYNWGYISMEGKYIWKQSELD